LYGKLRKCISTLLLVASPNNRDEEEGRAAVATEHA
jgi:hypothetical protein